MAATQPTLAVTSAFGRGFEGVESRINFLVKGAPTQNFGDYLPPLLAKHLLQGPRVEAASYRLVGSIIHPRWIRRELRHTVRAERGSIAFWGCGLREPVALDRKTMAMCQFYGARGVLTRDLLGLPPNTPLGDPGLLLPLITRPSGRERTVGKTVCIPHTHDPADKDQLLAASGCDMLLSTTVNSTEQDLIALINEIAAADFVLTGSLHGAIVACAYDRPFAYWDTGFVDIEFKWRDFSSSIGIDSLFVSNLAEGRAVFEQEFQGAIAKPPLAEILRIGPFNPKPSAIMAALRFDGALAGGEAALEALSRFDARSEPMVREAAATTRRTLNAWRDPIGQVGDFAGRIGDLSKGLVKRGLGLSG